jgi:anti-sigma factor RsiW
MSADKLNEDKFDESLRRALRSSCKAVVPADFTNKMLRQIREAEKQKALTRVVLQERLALAGCIVFGFAAVVAAVFLPSIVDSLAEQADSLVNKIRQTTETISVDWQVYAAYIGVSGFAVYGFVDLLVDEGWR